VLVYPTVATAGVRTAQWHLPLLRRWGDAESHQPALRVDPTGWVGVVGPKSFHYSNAMSDLDQIRRYAKKVLVASLLLVLSWLFYMAGYTMGSGK
jgi:hypothetical protein